MLRNTLARMMLSSLIVFGGHRLVAHEELSFGGCSECTCTRGLCDCEEMQKSAQIQHLSSLSEVQGIIAENPLVKVKFYGGKCDSCQAGKLFIRLARESNDGSVFVAYAVSPSDLDAVQALYGFETLPTIISFVNGAKDSVIYGG